MFRMFLGAVFRCRHPGDAVAVVGAQGDTNFSGAVYTYRDTGNGWIQDNLVLRPSALSIDDEFGRSVSVSGTPDNAVAVVGTRNDNGEGFQAGAAYTFRDTGSGWIQDTAVLRPSALEANDQFGHAVSVSGTPDDAVAIISSAEDSGEAGIVYTFRDTGNGWEQDAITLRPLVLQANDRFGHSVSVSGTPSNAIAVVGAIGYESTGGIFTFRDTADGWTEDATVVSLSVQNTEVFGSNVSVSGTPGNAVAVTIVVDGTNPSARAYSFRDTGSGWTDVVLIENPSSLSSHVGVRVQVSGTPNSAVIFATAFTILGNEIDDGSAFTLRDAESVPCFHGSVMIDTTLGYMAVRNVKLDTRVMCEDRHYHPVRRLTKSQNAVCICFLPGSLGIDEPKAKIIITPNHLVKLSNGTVMRASEAFKMAKPSTAYYTEPLTVYHLGFNHWGFIQANGLWLESLAWQDHHHQIRPYKSK